jgi:hypothetical protein
MQRKARPQPFATFTQPLRLRGSPGSFGRAMILCEDGQRLLRSGAVRVPDEWHCSNGCRVK